MALCGSLWHCSSWALSPRPLCPQITPGQRHINTVPRGEGGIHQGAFRKEHHLGPVEKPYLALPFPASPALPKLPTALPYSPDTVPRFPYPSEELRALPSTPYPRNIVFLSLSLISLTLPFPALPNLPTALPCYPRTPPPFPYPSEKLHPLPYPPCLQKHHITFNIPRDQT